MSRAQSSLVHSSWALPRLSGKKKGKTRSQSFKCVGTLGAPNPVATNSVQLLSAQLRKCPKQVPAFPAGQNTLADPAKRAINTTLKM